MLIAVEIEKCNDCPLIRYNCSYNSIYNVFKHFYSCSKTKTLLRVCNSEDFFIKIPEWCPCKIDK